MKIGWIGTGIMGKSMCHHLIEKCSSASKKNAISVFNRTQSKTSDLVNIGATFQTPEQMAKVCDVIFLMLGYPSDVKDVALTSENALLKHMKPGSILIDHTTSSPSLAREIWNYAKQKGITSVDAPVSGGDVGAKQGQLVIMTGGCDSLCFSKIIQPLFDCYSKKSVLFGESPGCGQHAKLSNQIIVASTMVGLCESLLYAFKSGLNADQLINLIKDGAAGSFSLTSYGPRILKRDFQPGFYVKHFVKDLGIVMEEAKKMNLCLPGTAIAEQLYLSLMANGKENCGTQALMLALEQLNNIKPSK
ncbi:hypothetical protein GJ496_007763 [Pomphorhynchus laevis]|nr:hypothetical protein GJ496_007763 [Pomphorhynchus laevis]